MHGDENVGKVRQMMREDDSRLEVRCLANDSSCISVYLRSSGVSQMLASTGSRACCLSVCRPRTTRIARRTTMERPRAQKESIPRALGM